MSRTARPRRAIATALAVLLAALGGVGAAVLVPAAGADPNNPVTTTGTGPTTPTVTPPPTTTHAATTAATPPPPAQTTPPPDNPADKARPSQGTGLFEDLGGDSPFCGHKAPGDIGGAARDSCRRTGAIANSYPSDNYGLDNNVDVGVTSPTTWITSTLQWLIGVVWLGLVYLVKGVLMALEWAFTTDIYDASKNESKNGVATMYNIVGAPWLTFALAIAGLWGLWNGLVRRRAVETLGALATTVMMMIAAQVVIHHPIETVGHLSDMSNRAALGALSAASEGTVDQPAQSFSQANRQLFDAIVLRPWCALEFGDVKYCTEKHGDSSVADVWLSFTPDSQARQLLFKRTKEGGSGSSLGDDFKNAISAGWSFLTFDPGGGARKIAEWQAVQNAVAKKADKVIAQSPKHVEMQESGGTMRRFALLVIVGVGVLGAVLLIGSIAVRLLIQGGLMTLLLLLLLPVALLAPAFGEGGRKAFVAYGRKFAAAIASKFIYSILLAVVILISGILAGLEGALGWLPCWIVQATFWWSLFLRRRELLAMVSLDSGRGGGGLSQLYYAMRIGREARGAAAAVTVRPVRAAIRPLRRNAMAHRHAEEHVARDLAREMAGARARELAGAAHADKYAAAAVELKNLASLRSRQADNKRELGDVDRRLAHAGDNNGGMDPDDRLALQQRRDRLRAENRQLEEWAGAPKYAEARAVAARGAAAPPMDDRDVQRWVQQRRWDTDHRSWDDDANLRAAGIDPSVHRAAAQRAKNPADTPAHDVVARHRQQSTEQMRRDRVLLAAAHDQRDAPPMARAERRARIAYAEGTQGRRRTEEQVELQARAERRRIRAERRRARVYR